MGDPAGAGDSLTAAPGELAYGRDRPRTRNDEPWQEKFYTERADNGRIRLVSFKNFNSVGAFDTEEEAVTEARALSSGPAAAPDAAAPADQTAPPQGRAPEAAAPAVPLAERVESDDERVARIKATPNAQRTDADLDWMRDRSRAEQKAREDAERDAAEATKEANKSLSIGERLANKRLEMEIRESATGRVMTRRQWVENRVAEGAQLRVEQEDKLKPMSRMQFFRANNAEQRAHEAKVKAAGKKDVYFIGEYEVTKTEYDYAQSLKSAPSSPEPAVSQSGETAPASETAPPKPKRPPKSFRKKVTVTTDVYVEEAGRFEQRETDADTALKALDEDVAELERLRKCLEG